jgi:hypothetical protein
LGLPALVRVDFAMPAIGSIWPEAGPRAAWPVVALLTPPFAPLMQDALKSHG